MIIKWLIKCFKDICNVHNRLRQRRPKRKEIVRDMYEKIHELILKQLCVVVVVKENCCTYHTGLLNKKFVIFVSPTGFEIHASFVFRKSLILYLHPVFESNKCLSFTIHSFLKGISFEAYTDIIQF